MENKFASNLFFTFETKAPKIVQEKWAAFRFSQTYFSLLKRQLPKLFKKNGQHFPPRMEIDLPQNYFFTFETKAPKVVQEKWAAFPP